MADAQAIHAAQRRRNRIALITILSVTVLSLAGSYGLYYLTRQGDVWGTTNNGEFVTPPTTVRSLSNRDQQNQPVTEGGTWWEVGIPEVSDREQVRVARAEWAAEKKHQRVGV